LIPGDLTFLKPDSLAEAVEAFVRAEAEGSAPLYYAGGTEILTMAREGKIHPAVLIDLKAIPECRELGRDGDHLVIGAALSLNEVIEAELFPLLNATAARVADHTIRNRLSLGGNVAGRLPYRETALPLLAAQAEVEIHGPLGQRREPIERVFSRRLELARGELVVRVRVSGEAARSPWYHGRRERGTRVDYPLATVCLLELRGVLRAALSGACAYPLGPAELDSLLGDRSGDSGRRAARIVEHLGPRIKEDFRASAQYRSFLLELLFTEGLERISGRRGIGGEAG
jgi:CO/xanthine dehydrogenase FAD-binding subunit